MRICLAVVAFAVIACKKPVAGTPCDGKASGRFQLLRVDENAPYTRRLLQHVGLTSDGKATDPAAIAANISADMDQWRVDEQPALHLPAQSLVDYYLVLQSPAALEPYLKQLGPELAVPADHRLVLEHLDGARWRTYYLEAKPLLDESAFASATIAQTYTRWGVNITLVPAAKEAFEATTRANVGHKLAIVVGGVVVSAPIINSPITGGTFSISLPSEAEAKQIATAVGCTP